MFAGDLGFRVFKLDSSNIRAWEPDRDEPRRDTADSVEHLKTDRTEQDILFELLLKLGLDLCVPIETEGIAGKTVHSIGGGVAARLPRRRDRRDEVEPLALGIVAWHKELAPAGEHRASSATAPSPTTWPRRTSPPSSQQNGLDNVRSL